jgi:hypothetical protein
MNPDEEYRSEIEKIKDDAKSDAIVGAIVTVPIVAAYLAFRLGRFLIFGGRFYSPEMGAIIVAPVLMFAASYVGELIFGFFRSIQMRLIRLEVDLAELRRQGYHQESTPEYERRHVSPLPLP